MRAASGFRNLIGCAGLTLISLAANPALAIGIDRTITIQPIDVCDNSGNGCANAGDATLNALEAATQAIWAQAGIGITFLKTETYDNSAYQSVTADLTTASPSDPARSLMRDPGHGQSSDPQVLNLYFVNQLTDAHDPGALLRGFSFTNGNGMILGPAPVLDTMAHEIGHNLGLDHTTFGAGASTDLMTAGDTRLYPTDISQIGAVDKLTPSQITQARSPLFSVGQLSMVAGANPKSNDPVRGEYFTPPGQAGVATQVAIQSPTGYPNLQHLTYSQLASNPFLPFGGLDKVTPASQLPHESLTGVQFRFKAGTDVTYDHFYPGLDAFFDSNGNWATSPDYTCDPATFSSICGASGKLQVFDVRGSRSIAGDGTILYSWTLNDPAKIAGYYNLTCANPVDFCTDAGFITGAPADLPPFGAYDDFSAYFQTLENTASVDPFSVQFTYADGCSSQGFFDETTHTASTLDPYATSYQPGTAPIADPAFVPPDTTSAPIEAETNLESLAYVPEPASGGLLLSGLLALIMLRRTAASSTGSLRSA